MHETWLWSLGGEDPPERAMATHSSILAWGNPWTEEPDGLQSMGLQRVEHDLATKQQPPSSYLIKCPSAWICLIRRDKAFLARSLLKWCYDLYPCLCVISEGAWVQFVPLMIPILITCLRCWMIELSTVNVFVFTFVINKYLVGRYFETIQMSCFSSHFCPLTLASFSDYFSATMFTVMFTSGHF